MRPRNALLLSSAGEERSSSPGPPCFATEMATLLTAEAYKASTEAARAWRQSNHGWQPHPCTHSSTTALRPPRNTASAEGTW